VSGIVWFEGRFTTPEQARVDLDDRGYLLGDGVFATLRGYAGRCFRTSVHLEGLARGAELLELEMPLAAAQIAELADEAARRTGERDAYVRVTLTRGGRLSILARALEAPHDDAYARGVAAVTLETRRRAPLDPVVKTTSYAPEIVARREAERRGAVEGIQLGAGGELAGGAMANLFVVVKDVLFTPSLASGCRDGVTRRAVMELAPRAGLAPREERLDPALLREAGEVFFTCPRVECLPVATIDGRAISASSPKTAALRTLLRQEALR
jgi:branched-chain amino acid aminotransferase